MSCLPATRIVSHGWDRFAESSDSYPASYHICHRTPLATRNANISAPRQQLKVGTKPSQNLVPFLTQEDPDISEEIRRPERSSSVSISHDKFIANLGDKFVLLNATETITIGRANSLKTVGFIQEKDKNILMSSISGMMTKAPEQENLLDNFSFTKAVLEFCQLTGHELPRNARDHGINGQFKACHVEKKLMLWFVGYHITDQNTGLLDKSLLIELREREDALTAVLTMDKDACQDCYNFRDELELLTGIVFEIHVAPTLMQTEQYREGSHLRRRLVSGGFKSMKEIISRQVTAGRKKHKKTIRTRTRTRARAESERPSQEPVIFAPTNLVLRSRVEIVIRAKPHLFAAGVPAQQPLPSLNTPPATPAIRPKRCCRHDGKSSSLSHSEFEYELLDALDRRCGLSKDRIAEKQFLQLGMFKAMLEEYVAKV